ncbi:MAG: FAD-dependent monooxygenase [Cytophagaceae bacterium]|nr:FAD-dependent monooxygenase [Cytophagaceae bacterium]MDW8456985.1 FAD-dependent monooxygenase [Cytophagaceae bacterium]
MKEPITILGAGIGGLSTALFMKQKNMDVHIYESAGMLRHTGAGILLANNAMQVLQLAGLKESLQKKGHRISCIKITDKTLKPLSVVDLKPYEKKYGVSNIAISRGMLLSELAGQVGLNCISFSKRLVHIENSGQQVLHFEDYSTSNFSCLIASDGIHSIVRKKLFPSSLIRKAHQFCWRGISNHSLPEQYHHTLHEAWGLEKRFGFVKLNDTQTYWYALVSTYSSQHRHIHFPEIFKTFNPLVYEIIQSTPHESIIVSDILDLKPLSCWSEGNICLIGDAAHATTPNLGQGACQAIEDAYTITCCLHSESSPERAFKKFQNLRMKKANKVIRLSRSIGKIAHIDVPWIAHLRNFSMKYFSGLSSYKNMDKIFNVDYLRRL